MKGKFQALLCHLWYHLGYSESKSYCERNICDGIYKRYIFEHATLLSAMERAGNEDTDPNAERRGLGTPATRAAVIEKLVKSGFVERKGKQLIPTENGNALISILPDMLTSPMLTAEWENNLTQIAKGAADAGDFMQRIEAMARELVTENHTADKSKAAFTDKDEKPSIGKCPRCGSPSGRGG